MQTTETLRTIDEAQFVRMLRFAKSHDHNAYASRQFGVPVVVIDIPVVARDGRSWIDAIPCHTMSNVRNALGY